MKHGPIDLAFSEAAEYKKLSEHIIAKNYICRIVQNILDLNKTTENLINSLSPVLDLILYQKI